MVFVSGFAGLAYQIVWMKQLGILFGSTSQAASVTLAAFFLGLGSGSWWWGRRVGASKNPMLLYAMLEFGIGVAALAYFGVLALLDAVYPSIYQSLGQGGGLLAVKFLFALLLVFPASFFMGGTVPAMGQVVIDERERFGRIAAVLYGVNTLGAALGVLAAAFLLIPSLGVRLTYGFAMLLSLLVGFAALRLAKRSWSTSKEALVPCDDDEVVGEPKGKLEGLALGGLCFFSGFAVLALEVIWTRIFAQVHENSVYSFAVILAVVLICLALGAGISSLVARFTRRPLLSLGLMAMIGGMWLVIGPSLLMAVTDGLRSVSELESWGAYVKKLFKMGIGGVGFVSLALGTVFPFLMKVAERDLRVPGQMLGRLLALNTAGAIAGALLGGFVLLPALGMWESLKVLTLLYLSVALFIPVGWKKAGLLCRGAGVVLIILATTVLDPSGNPVFAVPKGKKAVKILEVWEGTDCTVVAYDRRDGHRVISVNGGYALGSTAAFREQMNQARIPLHLFPETESICFIGLGTGMSAGAAFSDRFPKVKRVVSCELSPGVVEASKKWIPEELTGGLFSDSRSTVLIEDGRQYLRGTSERFDMINADLFLPYRRGAGSLYALEHFETVAGRLTEGGVFVQWLPLYQLTEDEFGVIVRTMCEAFPEVTMWRNNFDPGKEKVALIGRMESSPITIPPRDKIEVMRGALQGLEWWATTPDMMRVEPDSMPFLYAGNLTKARALFDDYSVNTDDKPVIEYQTPWSFREVVAQGDKNIWCVGPKLLKWVDRIFEASPLEDDPLFEGHPESSLHLVRSGLAFHQTMVSKALSDEVRAQTSWEVFKAEWMKATVTEE